MPDRGHQAVHIGPDDPRHRLPVVQPGPREDPRGGIGDPQRAGRGVRCQEAVVTLADEAVLRPARRRCRPGVAGDRARIAVAVERVGGGIAVVDLLAVRPERRGLQADMPQHRAGAEEREVHPGPLGGHRGLAFPQLPALVVAQGEHRPVRGEHRRVVDHRQVGRVADVEPLLLDPAHQGQLEGEEVAGALPAVVAERVRPVEGHHPGPRAQRVDPGRARAPTVVVVVAAVRVPGLPGQYVVLDQVGGVAGGVPHGERDVALLTAAAGELEQVVTGCELGRDGQPQAR
jgi:hypothetical protein